jgi:hypothetical protein
MSYDLCIAIPIGVSTPGTPNQKFLESCINSLKQQKTSFSYKIIVAADNNVPFESIEFLEKNNIEISWYPPHFYFHKGGIWKKIYDQWRKIDCEYVAFSHYDDMWHKNKLQNQLSYMKNNSLEISWSKVLQINDENKIISDDLTNFSSLNNSTIYHNSYAFCHSSIIKKEAIFKSNIVKHENDWSGIYEKLFFIYAHKFTGSKDNSSTFFHRVHNSSITNTLHNENDKNIVEQRKNTGYSLEQTMKDVEKIDLNSIIR